MTMPGAEKYLPSVRTLPELKHAAAVCKGCPLWQNATQTVFGEGPKGADIFLIGEQPGDQEDKEGRPFVGPAGRLLDRALEEAGIERKDVYVTNAVKHFKWVAVAGSTRRLHAKPRRGEVVACTPWFMAEIQAVRPKRIGCLGATAAQALFGPDFRITKERGKAIYDTKFAPVVVAMNHPSAILRARDSNEREAALRQLVEDLRLLRKAALRAA